MTGAARSLEVKNTHRNVTTIQTILVDQILGEYDVPGAASARRLPPGRRESAARGWRCGTAPGDPP